MALGEETRSKVKSDYHRPSGSGAGGDAIPFMIDGTYHVFELASPPGTIHHPGRLRTSWVRQRSNDLIHWTRDADPIVTPGSSSSDFDESGCWTGSAVIGPDGNMRIFYTGYKDGGNQVILEAKSNDRHGLTGFTKPERPIKIDAGSAGGRYETVDFRDPFVFYQEEEKRYWMLVATRLTEGPYWTRGCVALLTSSDLDSWTVEDQPLYAPNNLYCPECPEMFTLGKGKWYLAYSRFSAPSSGTLYVMADSPRGPWRSPRDGSGGRLDGRRWYAAKSCPKANDPSKRLSFAWVHDYCEEDGRWLWGGTLTQPREISSIEDGSLVVSVLPEFLQSLKTVPLPTTLGQTFPSEVQIESIGAATTRSLPVSSPPPGSTLCFSFSVATPDAKEFGILLQFSDDMRGYKVAFEQIAGDVYSVTLLTDLAPFDQFWADLTNHHIPKLIDGAELVKHNAVKLDKTVHVLLMEDIVEVFVGGKVLTHRLPRREKNVGHDEPVSEISTLGMYVEDGSARFEDLQLRQSP
ncbi:Arabinanase/levansucrase/invertase [Xylariaceae sp. FL1019]|nr:Arabinanase/levansucrase/invertase [Xylariaceae sp. FL1019]